HAGRHVGLRAANDSLEVLDGRRELPGLGGEVRPVGELGDVDHGVSYVDPAFGFDHGWPCERWRLHLPPPPPHQHPLHRAIRPRSRGKGHNAFDFLVPSSRYELLRLLHVNEFLRHAKWNKWPSSWWLSPRTAAATTSRMTCARIPPASFTLIPITQLKR